MLLKFVSILSDFLSHRDTSCTRRIFLVEESTLHRSQHSYSPIRKIRKMVQFRYTVVTVASI